MERLRRIFYGVSTIVLLLLFFMPRPYFPPDWVGALDKAVQQNDCDAVDLILYAALFGSLPGANVERLKIAKTGKCDWHVPETDFDGKPITPEQHMETALALDRHHGRTFRERVFSTSWFSSIYVPTSHFIVHGFPNEWRLAADFYQIWPFCGRQITAIAGVSNYRPMYLALSSPGLEFEKFLDAINAEKNYCARRLSTLALQLERDVSNPMRYGPINSIWFAMNFFTHTDKEVYYQMVLWQARAQAAFDRCVENETKDCRNHALGHPGGSCSANKPISTETAIFCVSLYLKGDPMVGVGEAYYFALLAMERNQEAAKLAQTLEDQMSDQCIKEVKDARTKDGPEPWTNNQGYLKFFDILYSEACFIDIQAPTTDKN